MGDKKLSDNEAINAALHLDGDPKSVKKFYEVWAKSYNSDTSSSEYTGPSIAAKLLHRHLRDNHSRLLDAGCGTGLVGIELQALGYSEINGFDLSDSMAKQARATGAYQQVLGGIDMMRAVDNYADGSFDAILSIGVFTLGHVLPEALEVLLQLTKPGGLLVISTREQYYDQTNYQQLVDNLTTSKQVTLSQLIKDAPYNNDGDAHYWVLKKRG